MTPIQLDFKPSVLLITFLLCFAILACLIVILVDMAWQWRLSVFLALAFSAAYAIARHGILNLRWSVVKLTVNAKNELHLYRKDGKRMLAQVEVSSVVTPYLTVLQLRTHPVPEKAWRNCQAVIVLADHVEREPYRQLRVWLRWGNHKKSDQLSLPKSLCVRFVTTE